MKLLRHQIAIVPSMNGYGHLRRCLSISKYLKMYGFKVSLVWDSRVTFPQWAIRFSKSNQIEVRFHKLPLEKDGPLLNVSGEMRAVPSGILENYDCVIADTVTWPLFENDNPIFIGQFTWELYKKKTQLEAVKDQYLPPIPLSTRIFGMSAYLWDEMRRYSNLVEIPILDYWGLRDRNLPIGLDFVYSPSAVKNFNLSELKHLSLGTIREIKGMENYVATSKSKPLGVFCRAGLGAVTESISIRSMPIFVPDDDYEINFNVEKSLEMGIGLRLQDFLDYSELDLRSSILTLTRRANWPKILTVERFVKLTLMEAI